jgi:hypothetical protein
MNTFRFVILLCMLTLSGCSEYVDNKKLAQDIKKELSSQFKALDICSLRMDDLSEGVEYKLCGERRRFSVRAPGSKRFNIIVSGNEIKIELPKSYLTNYTYSELSDYFLDPNDGFILNALTSIKLNVVRRRDILNSHGNGVEALNKITIIVSDEDKKRHALWLKNDMCDLFNSCVSS